MDRTTESLAAYASELTYSDLTPSAIHAAKRSLIDSIGCAFGAFHAEPCRAARRLASQVTAAAPATVIGTHIRTSPELAAFANGAMIRYLDFSDDYFGGRGDIGPHPSDNICGVLAAAESVRADGTTFILGMALAYEICAQIADKIDFGGVKPTWDYPVLHAIATALGAGKVLGLSRAELRDALALASVSNISLLQTRMGELSHWKGLAGPNGSRNGLFAAMLAREGISGPEDPLEGKAGWMKHLKMPFELGPLGGGKTPFKIERTFYKFMPVRYSAQLMIWIAFDLRSKVDIADIETICVYVPKRYVTRRAEHPEYWAPTTRETTDHSFPFLIGAALVDGEIAERTFTPDRFRDPALLALVDRIHMAEDAAFSQAFPSHYNCRFEVTLKSGEIVNLHQRNSKGHPENPMSDREIEDKFMRQADASGLPRGQSQALLDQLWTLDRQKNVGGLFPLMQFPEGVAGTAPCAT